MKIIIKNIFSKTLYIFFSYLSLIIFFFSTTKVIGKAFDINDIDISSPFEINFDKNEVIDEGFEKAFDELLSIIINSKDKKKINQIKLNEIKGMIESFSIKEEKFINEIYNVNFGVSFNKKKVFKYLEKKNIFPSIPINNKFLFIPVIIDENKKDLLIFDNNKIFDEWNNFIKKTHLIEYVLPTEDLEDLNLIKKEYGNIENYNFKEIINKYYLEDSIVALIFKNETTVRVLSKISIKDNVILKNQSFENVDLNDEKKIENLIDELKIIYEDFWKESNQINTSIKLILNIKIDSSNNLKISNFEEVLNQTDLVYDFNISKFDKDYIYYKVIFNGTPNIFLKDMKKKKYKIDTRNKIWVIK